MLIGLAALGNGQTHPFPPSDTNRTFSGTKLTGEFQSDGNLVFKSPGQFIPSTIALAAPTAAPTFTLSAPIYGSGVFAFGHTICAEETFMWEDFGETTSSPPSCVTISANAPAVAVFPTAPLGQRGVLGANMYINDNGGAFTRVRTGPNGLQKLLGFGDKPSWGGVIISGTLAGAPPGGNTAHDGDGSVVTAPSTRPGIMLLGNLPVSKTLYSAYSYVAGDGTETGLSPASASHATGVGGGQYAQITVPSEPPSGAVCYNEYMSIDGSTWHLQAACVPLSHISQVINAYTSSGAAPSARTAHSILCEFQQAYDSALNAGGGSVLVPAKTGGWACSTPVIFHLRNNVGNPIVGMVVKGFGGHDVNGTSSRTFVKYTGAISGVDCAISTAQSLHLTDLDFTDPNKRCASGLAMADWNSGSFDNHWENCSFQGLASGGFGLSVPAQGTITPGNGPGHVASEQFFNFCSLNGDAWGVDIRNAQSVDFRFHNATTSTLGHSSTADSGDVRLFSGNAQFDGWNSNGSGEFLSFQTDDENYPGGGGAAGLTYERAFSNVLRAPYLFYISNVADGAPPPLSISHSYITNTTGHQQYAFMVGAPSTIELRDNIQIAGGSTSNISLYMSGNTKSSRIINVDNSGNSFSTSALSAGGCGGDCFGGSNVVNLYFGTLQMWRKGSAFVPGIVAGTSITPATIRMPPVAFATLATCTVAIEGQQAAVNDSATNTWGSTITGNGNNHVLAYCDGTHWTVAGK